MSKTIDAVTQTNLPALGSMGALEGVFIVNDTTEKTIDFKALYVLEDTTIDKLNIGGTNARASYISTPGTAVKAGTYITPRRGIIFSGVKVTGSVALILV